MANELTRVSSTELAAAQALVNRHAAEAAQDAGGPAAAVASSPEMRALDAQIDAITALSHTGRLTDSDAYERRQGELLELVERRTALARGAASVPAASRTAAPRSTSSTPAAIADFPELPYTGQPAEVFAQDMKVWQMQVPKLAALGISPTQAVGLARIAREAEADGEALQVERAHHVREQSLRELERRYGPTYLTLIKKGNEIAKSLLPDGASRQLGQAQLRDGSLVGDSPLYCRLMIELAREAS